MIPTAVILFLRAPEKGKVKTRLSRDFGKGFVLDLYKAFVLDLLNEIEPGQPLFLFFHPMEKQFLLEQWLGRDYVCIGQQGKDLGQKMAHAFETVFDKGFDRAVLMGTDIPEMDKAGIRHAIKSLKQTDAVIGPSTDGGYYLIGLNRKVFSNFIFNHIQWSTPVVLDQTLAGLSDRFISYTLLEPLDDIDTVQDLSALKKRMEWENENRRPVKGAGRKTGGKTNALSIGRHTRKVLTSYGS